MTRMSFSPGSLSILRKVQSVACNFKRGSQMLAFGIKIEHAAYMPLANTLSFS